MSIDSGVRVGKYEVGRKLGQGGFGILHVARDQELGRDIAIKFLRPEHAFKPTVVQRFLQEARAAARINHPGIVTVFESGIVGGTNSRADGTVYIAMELLTGETLANRIKQLRPMPTTLAINYARQLASALGAAHQAGIVHRDLKPANVFLVPDPAVVGGERVKVLDFGIAKLVDDFGDNVQTHSMLMLGTPMYMSPEQCKSSAKVDARSDIYSLGCILFEMLCGQPPFGGDSGELIAKHQLVEPPKPRSLRGEVPAALDRLVTSMLAKSPDERPQTMGMVDDALAVFDAGTASTETMEDGPTRVAAASRMRGRLPIFLGAAGAIAIGITLGLLTMFGHHKKATTAAQTPVASDAAVAIVEPTPPAPTPPAPTPPEPTVAADAAVTPQDIENECLTFYADHKWAELSTCADRLADLDKEKAANYKATAQLETTAEREILAIEEAIAKQDKAKAKKMLAAVAKTSVYRKQAEEEIAAGKVTSRPFCDAQALVDAGMILVKDGQHAAALTKFEASLRCKEEPNVMALAFTAACNSHNAAKANQYYDYLSAPVRKKYKPICTRNKVAIGTSSAGDCDADALKDEGMEQVNMGKHSAALATFESSLACKEDAYVLSLAFMAACNAHDADAATRYYQRLTPDQRAKYKVMCTRNKTAYETPCDADALKDKGMENTNMGQFAAALAQFEASLRCKNDPYVTALAFMAACSAQNGPKAKQYYPKLTPAQQSKYQVMCIRNKTPFQ